MKMILIFNDISDIICLNRHYSPHELSFCVSLDNESSMNKISEPNLWHVGIVVRPSRPRRQDSQGN